MILKKIINAIVLIAILLQTSKGVMVAVNFKMNQDYIARHLCVNRNNPELHCNGRCVLMQRMEAQANATKERDRNAARQLVENEPVLFCQSFVAAICSEGFSMPSQDSELNAFYLSPISKFSLSDLLRPPSIDEVMRTLVRL